MKTIFDERNREELIKRIDSLTENSQAQWGKMTVQQMAKHCALWEDWIHGKSPVTYKQVFIGKVFGKMALKGIVKDDSPLRRNTPTTKAFLMKEEVKEMESHKQKWKAMIESYVDYSNPTFIHDFFGKMTVEQIGIMAYKHSDHHLRQFNS